tara:strand:- start:948 stop:1211 length:264 start_codon:yes stop_codon:yes gene_type:complete
MIIKLDSYQLMDALSEYLRTKNCNLDFDGSYVEIHALITEPIRQQKKHKNGRVMKDENGYAQWEIVGHEKKSVHINTNSNIEIYIGS